VVDVRIHPQIFFFFFPISYFSVSGDGSKIILLIVDEAHKAIGKYKYVTAIQKLACRNKYFRVIALSATPGPNLDKIQQVISNLLIEELDARMEDDPSVSPYIHHREIEEVRVSLPAQSKQAKQLFLKVAEPIVGFLKEKQVIPNVPESRYTKGYFFVMKQKWESQCEGIPSNDKWKILSYFNTAISLFSGYNKLQNHGLKQFLSFCREKERKERKSTAMSKKMGEIVRSDSWKRMVKYIVEITETGFSHPKMEKVNEIIGNHFRNATRTTKVIIFAEFRFTFAQLFYSVFSHSFSEIALPKL